MLDLIVSWILAAAALLLSDRLFDEFELKGDFATALWVAAFYRVLSFLIGWLVFGVLGIATLGIGFIFHFVTEIVAAAIVLRITSALSSRLNIRSFLPALGAAVLLALAGELSHRLLTA